MMAWVGKDGSSTIVLLASEETLMVHSNIGWMTFKKFDEGVTARSQALSLVEGWDLIEVDAKPYEMALDGDEPCADDCECNECQAGADSKCQCTSCMPYRVDGY